MDMVKRVLVVGLMFNAVGLFSQDTNIDTPNLSFENENFSNWELYEGQFYYDDTDGTYKYDNWVESPNTDKIEIVRGNANSQDPVIACWNLSTNPDGIVTARVGSNRYSESSSLSYSQGWPRGQSGSLKWATAEKMVYKFVVSENTTLLTYRFAAVLHCPDLTATTQQQTEHEGEMFPTFTVKVDVVDPATGLASKLPCGEILINGDSKSAVDLTVIGNNANNCRNSIESTNNLREFAFCPWTYGNFDLSKHIGKEVTVTVLNHDCLSKKTNQTTGEVIGISGGKHRAYGYFWAETKKLELKVKNCGLEDAEIIAPDGFVTYEWFRDDGVPVEVDPQRPQRAIIRQDQIKNGVKYSCRLSSGDNDCSKLTLDTYLQEVGVDIDFDYENDCAGLVYFTNKTKSDGDSIVSYLWDFGDGNTSNKPNPDAHFMKPDNYDVTVTVGTEMGCSKEITKRISVRYFPSLSISALDSVCYGESITLSALNTSVGSKFKWSTGETTQTIRVDSLKTTQLFTVEVDDEYYCTYKDSIWIVVKPSAQFEIDGDLEVCLNDTVTLTARATSSSTNPGEEMLFIWNTNDSTAEIKSRPLYDGMVYSVVGRYKDGCPMLKSVSVKVNPVPVATVSGTRDVCEGEEAVFSVQADGDVHYVWEDIATGDQTRTERPDSTTTYVVRAVDNVTSCVSLPKRHTVKVKPIPTIELVGDTVLCEGFATKISASGVSSSTIRWCDGTTGVNTITRKPTQDTTYWVEGESNGCHARAEITVRVWPTPHIDFEGDTELCPGEVSVLRAHGAHHYKWGSGQEVDSIVISPTISTSYMVYGYSDKECSTSLIIPVTVNPLPLVYTEGDHQACLGSSVKITAYDAGGNTSNFSWDNGLSGQTINPQINSASVFTVTAENKFGCVAQAVHEVALTTPPDLSYVGKTVVCSGEATTLQGVGALTYTWDDGETQVSGPSLNLNPTTNKTIHLTGSNVSNCPSSIDIPIVVNPRPVLELTGDSAVCINSPFSLSVSGASTYKWSTGDETPSITYNLTASSVYTVYGTNGEGCTSSVSKFVKVRQSPIVTISKGFQRGCQSKADTISLYAKGASTYLWTSVPENESVDQNNSSDHIIAYMMENTQFNVEGTDEYGCKGYASFDAVLLPRQEMRFTVYPTFIEEGSSNVRFSGISPKNSTWYWEADDNEKVYKGESVSRYFNPNAADSFVVKVRAIDKYGCEYTGSQSIYTWLDFWAPEGFTPNNDDLNDTFKFYGGEYMDSFKYIIYNRLGEIVFEGKSIHDEWDGTFNGEPCPWGVYGWYCKYKSNYMGIDKEGDRRGFVSLIR
ncbi:MAG: gliding motility-associated C-terminal domain-containing protein [Paludibacteraceae bacterium]|nr:gliding motility-associated C-terminal domain-containing protein [Paludibacteraceae bacterium]